MGQTTATQPTTQSPKSDAIQETRRFSIVLPTRLYRQIKSAAVLDGLSVNEAFAKAAERYLELRTAA